MANQLMGKLMMAEMGGTKISEAEAKTILRCLDVLHRVADNMCTNPAKEARDILQQIS